MEIKKLQGIYFDWSTWRSGSIVDLGIPKCRYAYIIKAKHILREYAIAWCYGEECLCRPKINRIAVMFKKGDTIFWNHLMVNEFEEIFDIITKGNMVKCK